MRGDVRKGMGIIASEARRLSGMVEELLEFSRIEDGRFTLSVEPLDLKAELEDAVYTYHEFLAAEGLPCTIPTARRSSPIPGDPDRLRQVFCNLLDNAAKHGGAGKRIDTAIFPRTAMRWSSPSETTARAFRRRNCPTSSISSIREAPPPGGSGIGLAVCEEIVTRHDGELIISNAEDEAGGCVVEVRLPTGT